MKKYHYFDGVNQLGPITLEELSDRKISKDTMIWYEGLENWTKASELEELKNMFKSIPPPLDSIKQTPPPLNIKTEQKPNTTVNNVKQKSNKVGYAIGLIGGVVAIALVVFFISTFIKSGSSSYDYVNDTYNTSPSNFDSESSYEEETYTPPAPKKKTEEELIIELGNTECANPLKYLKLNNKDISGIYKNALSLKYNGFKIKFNIVNTATIATFKNVKCRITLSSNSGSTILSTNFSVNEFVGAGSDISYNGEFECTNQQFRDTDKYLIEILGAECH